MAETDDDVTKALAARASGRGRQGRGKLEFMETRIELPAGALEFLKEEAVARISLEPPQMRF